VEYDKGLVYKMLITPTNWVRFPTIKDKIAALQWLNTHADVRDVEHVYPVLFEKNRELAMAAARVICGIMEKIEGRDWNSLYNRIKYTKINENQLVKVLVFPSEMRISLLGVASLNWNGYVREKALKLMAGIPNGTAIPYILLRLNDWIKNIRELALHILKNTLTEKNIDVFINHFYLVDKLANVQRTNLNNIRDEIITFLKQDAFKEKIKIHLNNPDVKTRLFCYELLKEKMLTDEDIIQKAMVDKSFEVRMWLLEAIKIVPIVQREAIIEKLLYDKYFKVKTTILLQYEEMVCIKYRDRLKELLFDENSSVRDLTRFIMRKNSIMKDIPQVYRKQIVKNPLPGAILGLGETGDLHDYQRIISFKSHHEPKIKVAAMKAMWFLSKEDATDYVIESLDSSVPKIRKTARQLLIGCDTPEIFEKVKRKLETGNLDTQLTALDIIYRLGSWQALEGILYVLVNKQGPVFEKGNEFLDRWLMKSGRIFSSPGQERGEKIKDLCDRIRDKDLLSQKIWRELKFFIDTRV